MHSFWTLIWHEQIFTTSTEEFNKLENPWTKTKTTESNDKEPVKKADQAVVEQSNIRKFIKMLGDLLSYLDFTMKDIEKSNAHIEEKYPKFLSKFALFALQMDDTLFRETFIVQILIFTQAITDPVGNEHKNTVKLSPEEIKSVQKVQKQANRIVLGQKKTTSVSRKNNEGTIGKRTFGESVQ